MKPKGPMAEEGLRSPEPPKATASAEHLGCSPPKAVPTGGHAAGPTEKQLHLSTLQLLPFGGYCLGVGKRDQSRE
jgi:hypothetical protein